MFIHVRERSLDVKIYSGIRGLLPPFIVNRAMISLKHGVETKNNHQVWRPRYTFYRFCPG